MTLVQYSVVPVYILRTRDIEHLLFFFLPVFQGAAVVIAGQKCSKMFMSASVAAKSSSVWRPLAETSCFKK